jgi:hypothetical protein
MGKVFFIAFSGSLPILKCPCNLKSGVLKAEGKPSAAGKQINDFYG